MSTRVISVKCPNIMCGHVNTFAEDSLRGEVPLMDKEGARVPPPPVEVDENTFVQCEKCRYPISCENATISDQDDHD